MEEKQLPTERQWLIEIDQALMTDNAAESARWSKRSIYKIPVSFTNLNERAYKPQIVSIGPYHHGTKHLMAMEQHKCRALIRFLKRSKKCVETLIELLIPVVEDVKGAYDQLDSKWDQNTSKFLEMMILDGCFILEILQITNKMKWLNEVADDYAENDPIFSYHARLYVFENLRYDMLMLENQIPILVLEKLASVRKEDPLQEDHELTKLILNFFSQGQVTWHLDRFQSCLHMLDVHRRSLFLEEPSLYRSRWKICQRHQHFRYDRLIRSVTEFEYAGIRIKPSKSRSLRDITFRDGYLRLPPIVVDDALESLFRNLMAFERFHVGAGNEATSYIYFMDSIIANARDVSLLVSRRIIENDFGSDMAVANLFESLSREATFDPDSRLVDVHMEVNAYCQRPWNTWKANFWRNYITTPYAGVSVAATSFVICLTIAQTAFSVLSYAKQSPNGS